MEYHSENRDARRDRSGKNKALPVSRLPLIIAVQTVPDASFAVGNYSWQTAGPTTMLYQGSRLFMAWLCDE